jgi:hypothetical protein
MTSQTYLDVLNNALTQFGGLMHQRDSIEVEISKMRQFIFATVNMLSDVDRNTFFDNVKQINMQWETKENTLSDAVRDVLYGSPRNWFTVAQVRDAVVEKGFDFSNYSANPLASVSTTLRRLVPKEAESTELDGVNAFRWRNTKAAKLRMENRNTARLMEMLGLTSLSGEMVTPQEEIEFGDGNDVEPAGEGL